MGSIVTIVLPVALVVALGAMVGARFEIDVRSLTTLTIWLLSPALIADTMLHAKIKPNEAIGIVVVFAFVSVVMVVAARLAARALSLDEAGSKSLQMAALLPNAGNLGLSLTLLALGQAGFERGIVTFSASAVLAYGAGPALLSGGFRSGLRQTVRLPLIWAFIAGAGANALDAPVPAALSTAIHLIGSATIPLLLVTLGIQLARTPLGVGRSDLVSTGLRLIVAPAAAWLLASAFGLSELARAALVIQCGTPTAVNTLVLATQFGGDRRLAARAIMVSTLAALVSLPVLIWLLGY